jgi:hypothetical protein
MSEIPRIAQAEPVSHLIAMAQAGDADAQFDLAERCRTGDGVEENAKEALRWYRAAADTGHASAQNNLGSMYLHGIGAPVAFVEAVRWYRAAAAQGIAVADYNIAICYQNGEGVPHDDALAVQHLWRASLGGYDEADLDLGVAYRFGRGVAASVEEAALHFIDAAERGSIAAMGNLCDCGEELESLALEGSLTAAHCLATMYAGGLGVAKDRALEYAWVRWGLREGVLSQDDDGRGNFEGWLTLLRAELPREQQRHGLREFNRLREARDLLRRISAPGNAASKGVLGERLP